MCCPVAHLLWPPPARPDLQPPLPRYKHDNSHHLLNSLICTSLFQSTALQLSMVYAPSLPHPMKMEQAEMDVDASMITSNCLNTVSFGFEDQLGDTSSLPLSSSSLFTTCPPLSSLTASIEQGGAKEEGGMARPKVRHDMISERGNRS